MGPFPPPLWKYILWDSYLFPLGTLYLFFNKSLPLLYYPLSINSFFDSDGQRIQVSVQKFHINIYCWEYYRCPPLFPPYSPFTWVPPCSRSSPPYYQCLQIMHILPNKSDMQINHHSATSTSHARQPCPPANQSKYANKPNQDGYSHREQERGLGFPGNGRSQAFCLPSPG